MSIAEKLQTVANNLATESEAVERQTKLLQQLRTALVGKTVPCDSGDSGSYDEGYADGQQDVLDAVNIELSGRGLEELNSADEIPHKLDEAFLTLESNGYESGKQAEYDRFWDAWQDNGKRTDYSFGFAYSSFNDDTFKPKYPLQPTNADRMFMGAKGITKISVDLSKATNVHWAFRNMPNIQHIGKCDLTAATTADGLFGFNSYLKSIEEIVSHDGVEWDSAFAYDVSLTDVTFSGVIGTNFTIAHSRITDATAQSIIDHLKDLTGATAQTLTFHETVGAKLTQAQKDAISAKNWTLAY